MDIKIHSSVDLITNSSTVLFTYSPSYRLVVEIINAILHAGGSDKKAADLFEIKPTFPQLLNFRRLFDYAPDKFEENFPEENPEIYSILSRATGKVQIQAQLKAMADEPTLPKKIRDEIEDTIPEAKIRMMLDNNRHGIYEENIRIVPKAGVSMTAEMIAAMNKLHELFQHQEVVQ